MSPKVPKSKKFMRGGSPMEVSSAENNAAQGGVGQLPGAASIDQFMPLQDGGAKKRKPKSAAKKGKRGGTDPIPNEEDELPVPENSILPVAAAAAALSAAPAAPAALPALPALPTSDVAPSDSIKGGKKKRGKKHGGMAELDQLAQEGGKKKRGKKHGGMAELQQLEQHELAQEGGKKKRGKKHGGMAPLEQVQDVQLAQEGGDKSSKRRVGRPCKSQVKPKSGGALDQLAKLAETLRALSG
jgi:hypothetical protein